MAVENKIIGVESGGDRFARNPRSTAYGPGQFIESTWLDLIRRHRPDLMQGRTRAEILELRSDEKIAPEMTRIYGEENANNLRAKGFEPTESNVYLSHFAGPQGAIKLLSNPQGRAVDTLTSDAIAANPFLKDWSNQQVIDWAGRKMGFQPMAVANQSPAPPPSSSPSSSTGGNPSAQEGKVLEFLASLGSSGNLMAGLGKSFGSQAMTNAGNSGSLFGSLANLFGDNASGMPAAGSPAGGAQAASGMQGGSGGMGGFGTQWADENMKLAQQGQQAASGGQSQGPQAYQRKPVDLSNLMKILQQRAQLGVGGRQPGPGLGA